MQVAELLRENSFKAGGRDGVIVQNNPINWIDPFGLSPWWDPRNYFGFSTSRTLGGIGRTYALDGSQQNKTYDPNSLYGLSFDLAVGAQQGQRDSCTEAYLGMTQHLGVGLYALNDSTEISGVAFHLGIGIATTVVPGGIAYTKPADVYEYTGIYINKDSYITASGSPLYKPIPYPGPGKGMPSHWHEVK